MSWHEAVYNILRPNTDEIEFDIMPIILGAGARSVHLLEISNDSPSIAWPHSSINPFLVFLTPLPSTRHIVCSTPLAPAYRPHV